MDFGNGNGLFLNCFSKITADFFPPWHFANTHLNAPEQQTAKTSAFIEVLALC